MKVEHINPFIRSTLETFEAMVQLKLETGKPFLKRDPFPSYDVSGIIGISGDAVGSIALSFPKLVALKVVSKFLGEEIKIVGPDLTDSVGELNNIISGNAKKYLKDCNISISLPNVIVGHNHQVVSPRDSENMIVPFSSEVGEIALEVSLKTS